MTLLYTHQERVLWVQHSTTVTAQLFSSLTSLPLRLFTNIRGLSLEIKNEYQGRRWHLLKATTEPGPTELKVILHWLFDSATFWHLSKTTSLRLGEHNNLGYLFHKQGSVKAKETKTNVDFLVHLDPSFLPCTTSSAIFPTSRTEPRTIAPSRLPKTAPMTLISCSNSFM